MDNRRGTALLFAGHVAERDARRAPAAGEALDHIAELLRATTPGWHVVRLAADGAPRVAATRAKADRALRVLHREVADLTMIVASGSILTLPDGEPARLTDPRWRESASSAGGPAPVGSIPITNRYEAGVGFALNFSTDFVNSLPPATSQDPHETSIAPLRLRTSCLPS